MKAKFNFNTHQLTAGSRIVNAPVTLWLNLSPLHGKHLTHVTKTIVYGCR